ncbi:hypothetical protein D3C73_1046430 [compost metagenome]
MRRTSAPSAPNRRVDVGPAMTRVRSSTLSPSNGRSGSADGVHDGAFESKDPILEGVRLIQGPELAAECMGEETHASRLRTAAAAPLCATIAVSASKEVIDSNALSTSCGTVAESASINRAA